MNFLLLEKKYINMAAQRLVLFLVLTLLASAVPEFSGVVQGYNRPPARKNLDVPSDDDPESNSPEQVRSAVNSCMFNCLENLLQIMIEINHESYEYMRLKSQVNWER